MTILKIRSLLSLVAEHDDVEAIGWCGSLPEQLLPGESDVDIFLLCRHIPPADTRAELYRAGGLEFGAERLNVCEGGFWGTGDLFLLDGVDVMLMYFQTSEVEEYLNEVLAGRHLDSVHGCYPAGRCATYLQMTVISDKLGRLAAIKEKLAVYPEELSRRLTEHHLHRAVDDEDFGRVRSRKDVLFYHQVLEQALDHFLQALFALNRAYFPSRKRSQQYTQTFSLAPADCYQRLLRVIQGSTHPETIEESVEEWYRLVGELRQLARGSLRTE